MTRFNEDLPDVPATVDTITLENVVKYNLYSIIRCDAAFQNVEYVKKILKIDVSSFYISQIYYNIKLHKYFNISVLAFY